MSMPNHVFGTEHRKCEQAKAVISQNVCRWQSANKGDLHAFSTKCPLALDSLKSDFPKNAIFEYAWIFFYCSYLKSWGSSSDPYWCLHSVLHLIRDRSMHRCRDLHLLGGFHSRLSDLAIKIQMLCYIWITDKQR
jgi:hypothetical protein